jgi:hypothetical protein
LRSEIDPCRAAVSHLVMAGLIPAISAFGLALGIKTRMPATSAGMTWNEGASQSDHLYSLQALIEPGAGRASGGAKIARYALLPRSGWKPFSR